MSRALDNLCAVAMVVVGITYGLALRATRREEER